MCVYQCVVVVWGGGGGGGGGGSKLGCAPEFLWKLQLPVANFQESRIAILHAHQMWLISYLSLKHGSLTPLCTVVHVTVSGDKARMPHALYGSMNR